MSSGEKTLNFIGLKGSAADYTRSRVVVVQAPYEVTCTYGKGAARGPAAIIHASVAAEFYDEEVDLDLDKVGIATLSPPAIETMEPEQMVETIYRTTYPAVRDGKIVAGLGGEHTVTLGFLKAVSKEHRDLSVLQIDAHPDLRDHYEGRPLCHATVGRRIIDSLPLTQVGIRSFTREEQVFLRQQKEATHPRVHPFSAAAIGRDPMWIDQVVATLSGTVYISLDLDGLDPSLLPHTGTPEPGGLSWRMVCDLLAAVASAKKIVGFDVVELAPNATSQTSDFIAARLVMRMMALALQSPDAGLISPMLPF